MIKYKYSGSLLNNILCKEKIVPAKDYEFDYCRDYFKIKVDKFLWEFGDWLVNTEGDVVSIKHDYSVFADQLMTGYQTDLISWLCHLRYKTWFDTECEHNFITAFVFAIMAKQYKQERMDGRTTDKTRD